MSSAGWWDRDGTEPEEPVKQEELRNNLPQIKSASVAAVTAQQATVQIPTDTGSIRCEICGECEGFFWCENCEEYTACVNCGKCLPCVETPEENELDAENPIHPDEALEQLAANKLPPHQRKLLPGFKEEEEEYSEEKYLSRQAEAMSEFFENEYETLVPRNVYLSTALDFSFGGWNAPFRSRKTTLPSQGPDVSIKGTQFNGTVFNGDQTSCPICSSEYHNKGKGKVVCNPCGHVFCKKCITRLRRENNPNCAICRANIRSVHKF